MPQLLATFSIDEWKEVDTWDAPGEGPALGHTRVRKSFSGAVSGTSVAELQTCKHSDEQAGYVATERLSVTIGERQGTFVIQHGAIVDRGTFTLFGHIVPGSGTGKLTGITGTARFEHDEGGARLTLDYDLA